jgi:hypothetical protein
MTEKFTTWELVRIGYAALLLIYVLVIVYALTKVQDANLSIGLIGVAFAVVGLSFSIISTISTEREIKKLHK